MNMSEQYSDIYDECVNYLERISDNDNEVKHFEKSKYCTKEKILRQEKNVSVGKCDQDNKGNQCVVIIQRKDNNQDANNTKEVNVDINMKSDDDVIIKSNNDNKEIMYQNNTIMIIDKVKMDYEFVNNYQDKIINQNDDSSKNNLIFKHLIDYNMHRNNDNSNQANIPMIKDVPINNNRETITLALNNEVIEEIIVPKCEYKVLIDNEDDCEVNLINQEGKSKRLRKLSQQLPKIIINRNDDSKQFTDEKGNNGIRKNVTGYTSLKNKSPRRPKRVMDQKRMISKSGIENVASITNVPFERIRLLNDTFHTLINLRWRWIVMGTIILHFTMWLVFAVFWYIAAWAHYDFEPNPPKKSCVTGGKDFLSIFLASVESQTTIGFGDRAIDEECPESIFLFVMQLIIGTGLSGVLTCVVYAKLTRPEKLSRDGVGFSNKAVISVRDGKLCLMLRAWDLNYDHIINSQFTAHFVKTHRSKENEVIKYYVRPLHLQQQQFLLWPVTLVHVIDHTSPLYDMGPKEFANYNYEITVSLKGASSSMGTYTQSQTSYLPKEVYWGYKFPSVVRYDNRKQKYVIDDKKLNSLVPVDTPLYSAYYYERSLIESPLSPSPTTPNHLPPTPSSFSEKVSIFHQKHVSTIRLLK